MRNSIANIKKHLFIEDFNDFYFRAWLEDKSYKEVEKQIKNFISEFIQECIKDYPDEFDNNLQNYKISDYYFLYGGEDKETEDINDVWFIDINLEEFAEPYIKNGLN